MEWRAGQDWTRMADPWRGFVHQAKEAGGQAAVLLHLLGQGCGISGDPISSICVRLVAKRQGIEMALHVIVWGAWHDNDVVFRWLGHNWSVPKGSHNILERKTGNCQKPSRKLLQALESGGRARAG